MEAVPVARVEGCGEVDFGSDWTGVGGFGCDFPFDDEYNSRISVSGLFG